MFSKGCWYRTFLFVMQVWSVCTNQLWLWQSYPSIGRLTNPWLSATCTCWKWKNSVMWPSKSTVNMPRNSKLIFYAIIFLTNVSITNILHHLQSWLLVQTINANRLLISFWLQIIRVWMLCICIILWYLCNYLVLSVFSNHLICVNSSIPLM